MKFSTSPSATLCLLAALATTTVFPDSSIFASAKPLLPEEKSNDNKSPSSPRFEIPGVPFPRSPHDNNHNHGSLSLVGLDPTMLLTRAETAFFEEALRDVFNMFPEENGIDLVTRSVSIQQNIANAVPNNGDGGNGNGNGKKRSLRSGDRGRVNNDKMHFRDDEMCEYKSGPLKGEVIPGCKFDIFYYRDCYCHNCDDDFQPNDTRHPSTAPSVHPLRKFLNNLDDDNPPNDTRHPSAAPSLAPSTAPTSSLLPSSAPVLAPTDTGARIERKRSPNEPGIYQIHMMNIKFCKMLKASGFPNFKKVRKCQFKRGSIFKNLLGGN